MLTKEQLLERRKGIGGSDAARIVGGDWFALWQEKTGQVEPEDLSGVWAVQLGSATEALNLDWFERKTGHVADLRGEVRISQDYPFLRCTLDGFDTADMAVIQAKHCNGFSKIDEVRARYTPQVIHEMIVLGVRKGVLSVIIGTNEPVLEAIEYDEFWANEYIEMCREFWSHVERKEPPTRGAPIAVEIVQASAMRVVDMTGSNAWASAATDWLNHSAAAKLFEKAVRDLKAMVEPDVRKASGHGIEISRNKAGSLSIKPEK